MSENVSPPEKLIELPEETRNFLSQMRDDDIQTLKDGLRLVTAIRTVGIFMKWLIVGIVGLFVGFVMLWESVLKFLALLAHQAPK